MDRPKDYHTKQSKSEREIQTPHDITYIWNLKHDRNEPIYGTETGSLTENRLVVTRVGSWGGMECEIGVSRCKLSYVGWINNKVLLYSTGNCIQYPMINHTVKEH